MRQSVVGNVVASLAMVLFVLIFGSGAAFSQDIVLDNQTGALDSTVTYTVSINNAPNGVTSFFIHVTFDTNVLSFDGTIPTGGLIANGATAGPLVDGWNFVGITEPTEGTIRIGGSTVANPITAGTSGVLAQLTFTVIGEANTTLNIVDPGDDVATWTLGSGTFAPPAPPPPAVANADSAQTTVGTAVSIPVLDNDEGEGLTVTSVTEPANGTATTDGTTVTYTPAAGFVGQDMFDYTVSNDGGNDTATVTVTVVSVPVPNPDSAQTTVGTAVSIPVLDNDGGEGLTVTSVTDPANGTATTDGTTVTYTPAVGFIGEDTFDYTVSNDGGNATTTVTVTVVEGPTAQDDSGVTLVDMAATISVLANDTGEGITVTAVTSPANGTATTDGTTVTYTPAAGFVGQDTFMYTISNDAGSATATVTVNVQLAEFLPGVETPDPDLPIDVAAGTEDSVIQVRVSTGGEGVNLTSVMVAFSDLMGDQSLADSVTINVINDANGNGLADADEPVLASGLLSDVVDNVLSLTLNLNIPAVNFADLLITVQVSQTSTASLVSPRLPASFMHLGWLGVLSSVLGLVFMGRLRRRFPRLYTALAILLVAGSLVLVSCNNNHNGGSDELTFTSSIPANGVAGTGDTSGTAFSGPATAITGPAVTVMP